MTTGKLTGKQKAVFTFWSSIIGVVMATSVTIVKEVVSTKQKENDNLMIQQTVTNLVNRVIYLEKEIDKKADSQYVNLQVSGLNNQLEDNKELLKEIKDIYKNLHR